MLKYRNASKRKSTVLLKDLDKAKAVLKNINWDFHSRRFFRNDIYPFDCRKYHWYPSTFIPEIPFTLIEVLTLPNAVIYDPFGGIGTTYFQSLLLNRKPVTTEICSISVKYMRSLFALFNPSIDFDCLKKDIDEIAGQYKKSINYVSKVPKQILIDKLEPWYSPETLNQLSFLFIKEENCDETLKKSAMWISLSSILKTASSQDRGWGCVADNVIPKKTQIKDKNAIDLFKGHINVLLKDIKSHLNFVGPEYAKLYGTLNKKQTIFQEDVRNNKEIEDESVDLVVTSPPYPNMTDYVTSQRLSYYSLGFNLEDKRCFKDFTLEIGARSKRAGRDSLDNYLSDMIKAIESIARKIKKGGYACFVMPVFGIDNKNNTSRKSIIQKVLSCTSEYNLLKEEEYERILPSIRRSQNKKWASLEREKIYLFQKV